MEATSDVLERFKSEHAGIDKQHQFIRGAGGEPFDIGMNNLRSREKTSQLLICNCVHALGAFFHGENVKNGFQNQNNLYIELINQAMALSEIDIELTVLDAQMKDFTDILAVGKLLDELGGKERLPIFPYIHGMAEENIDFYESDKIEIAKRYDEGNGLFTTFKDNVETYTNENGDKSKFIENGTASQQLLAARSIKKSILDFSENFFPYNIELVTPKNQFANRPVEYYGKII